MGKAAGARGGGPQGKGRKGGGRSHRQIFVPPPPICKSRHHSCSKGGNKIQVYPTLIPKNFIYVAQDENIDRAEGH